MEDKRSIGSRCVTARQLEVLRFVANYVDEEGYPPSLKEVSSHLGNSINASNQTMKSLIRRGLIHRKAHGAARAITVTEDGWRALATS